MLFIVFSFLASFVSFLKEVKDGVIILLHVSHLSLRCEDRKHDKVRKEERIEYG